MKKQVAAMVTAGIMALSLAGCTTSNQVSTSDSGSTVSSTSTEAVTSTSTTTSTSETESIATEPQERDAPLKMAYVNAGMNTYYSVILNGMQEELERYGGDEVGTIDVYSPTSTTQMVEEQISFLEALLQDDDLDVLFFSTHNDTEFIPYLEQFCEKGVSVYLFNMPSQDVTNDAYVSLISYDFYEAGYLMGQYLAENVATTMDEVNLLYLEGVEGTHNTVRTEGFYDGLGDADAENGGNVTTVVSQSASWTREGGQTVTENALQSNPEINCVFGPYDEMPLGAIVALKDAGKLDDTVVLGYDCTEDGLNAIRDGEMTASVATDPKQMGNHMIDAAIAHDLCGEEINSSIMNKLVVIDSSNESEVADDAYEYTEQEKSMDIEDAIDQINY
jgi:ribose transport system substrate-binding protein